MPSRAAEHGPMPSDNAAKSMALVGTVGVLCGFTAGFSFAERIYATDAQKSSVRILASVAAAACAITAAVGAVSVMRARASV